MTNTAVPPVHDHVTEKETEVQPGFEPGSSNLWLLGYFFSSGIGADP